MACVSYDVWMDKNSLSYTKYLFYYILTGDLPGNPYKANSVSKTNAGGIERGEKTILHDLTK